MSPRDTAAYHRGYGRWSAIAGTLFLIVAIFGREPWGWGRLLCLIGGICSLAISIREFKRAKSAG
jgi:hypothetical protein